MLPADARSARRARTWVTGILDAWQRDARRDDVRLVVTELVANAVVHARTRITLRIDVGPEQVRCAVSDRADGTPTPRTGDPDAPGGRGLHLVDCASDRWGIERSRAGKTVWAEWRCPRRRPGAPESPAIRAGRFRPDRRG